MFFLVYGLVRCFFWFNVKTFCFNVLPYFESFATFALFCHMDDMLPLVLPLLKHFEVQMQQEEAERQRQVEEHQLRVQHAQARDHVTPQKNMVKILQFLGFFHANLRAFKKRYFQSMNHLNHLIILHVFFSHFFTFFLSLWKHKHVVSWCVDVLM